MKTKNTDQTKYRQGDVLFTRCSAIPQGGTKRENGTVAYGEVTGHSHRMQESNLATAEVFECGAGLFVRVSEEGVSIEGDAGATFIHEEHGPISLAPGDYEITIQREYSPEAIRNVID